MYVSSQLYVVVLPLPPLAKPFDLFIFKIKMIEFSIKILGSIYKYNQVNLKEIIRKIMR